MMLVLAVSPAPYVIRAPGPTFDALGVRGGDGDDADEPVIRIDGAPTYANDRGSLTVMTVNLLGSPQSQPRWFEALIAWADPTEDVLPLEVYYPDGTTVEQRDEEAAQLMTGSQDDAVAAALRRTGHEVPSEVVVASVQQDGAAAGILEAGDVLERVGVAPVPDLDAVSALGLEEVPTEVVVERDGEERIVTVTPRRQPEGEGERALLGVEVQERFDFPIDVSIHLGDVGGPSAGLVFALALYDKLTEGELTGDEIVAGTGTMSPDGTVGEIGGIRQKLFAAESEGASYFLAPRANCAEAVAGPSPSDLDVYAVADLDEAIEIVDARASGADDAGFTTCAEFVAEP